MGARIRFTERWLLLGAISVLLSACAHVGSPPSPDSTPDKQDISASALAEPDRFTAPVPTPNTPTEGPSAANTDGTLWPRLRAGLALGHINHPRIDREIGWLENNRDVLAVGSERARPYLYYILERIEARHLPAELALIPLLESGFRPLARSRHGAVGLWQFMPATARQFGLDENFWFDERRDVVAGTEAGLAYLTDLYHQFGDDWLLAIAAYNCGPGKLQKIIKRSGHRDFWKLVGRLPPETQRYVPKLIAAGRAIAEPRRIEVKLADIPDQPFFETIDVQAPVDLAHLDSLPNWDSELFMRLNAAMKRKLIDRRGSVSINVPVGLGKSTAQLIAALEPPKPRALDRYIVQTGDTLTAIALARQVPIERLRSDNRLRGDFIKAGQTLMIRSTINLGEPDITGVQPTRHHIVAPGDSLWTIGRSYGVSPRALAAANRIAVNKTLFPGQQLILPERVRARPPGDVFYIVVRGDSLWAIAKKFGVRTSDLKRWNKLKTADRLKPGQRLVVKQIVTAERTPMHDS